ncbi:MAG: hypothetical protein WDN04_26745 [Rhodospirillales bacterium]
MFDRSATGTLTPGNSTPLTDGAGCVLLASDDWARARAACRCWRISPARPLPAVDFVGLNGPPPRAC